MGVNKKLNKGNAKKAVETEDVFKEFINEKEIKGLVEKSIKGYRDSFSRFIAFSDEVKELKNITKPLVNEWIKEMKDKTDASGNVLAPASINSHVRNVRAFLYWCMSDERPRTKKLTRFTISEVTGQGKGLKDFEKVEIDKLLKKPTKIANNYNEWREWAICNFVLGTGARTGTFLNIKLEDLDFKNKKIRYTHTKNKLYQVMSMSKQVAKVLKEFIDNFHDAEETDEYLFANVKGGKLNDDAFRNGFRRYAQRRGVEKTNIHGLRHSYARDWIVNGGDIVQLQKILGHGSIRMTEKYVNVYGEGLPDDFEKHNPLDVMTVKKSRERKMKANR